MNVTKPVLLTVSGRIPADLDEQVAAGLRPRADYVVMRDAFDADLVDVDAALAATGRVGHLIHRLGGPGPLLGWYCFRRRRRYEVIVTDGEQVGLPLALLSRVLGRGTARHMMIVHILSTPMKARLVRFARLAGLIDRYVVYCSWQRDFVVDALSVPADRVLLSTFMVDTAFFDPALIDVEPERMICSAGLERRDYATLMEAVEGLDVQVVIAAASPWSKQSDATEHAVLPANVEVRKLNLFELRELYARSRFVVMPLEEVEFQAGITTILEAMSMGKAVLCTRTSGQTDTVTEGQTGRYVPPNDAGALRDAIVTMLDDDAFAHSAGEQAREWAVANADITVYASRLSAEVDALRARHAG
jgi:glycosyltransferase involved in cell wall biosynthesis